MNPTATPTPAPMTPVTAKPVWERAFANRYTMPALIGVLGLLLGIGLMAVVTPRPVNPATYTRPLQTQQASLQAQTRYMRVMALNYTLLVDHYNQLVTDLNANNLSASEVDATTLATSTQTYLNDLKTLTVPACLAATNTALLDGLTSTQTGASALDKALVANDAGQESAAADQLAQGLSRVKTAEAAYAAATC